jgi:predicted amidohydrolase YtcJ
MLRTAEEPADLIVAGATIHAVDDSNPAPQAFAVRKGRFIFVGSTEGAMALRGSATRLLDASGSTILPGLIDAHLHLTNLGMRLEQAALENAESFEEVVARTVTFARSAGEEWILGRGWDQNRWPGKTLPSHDALSAAFPDRPVALTRIDGHALLANARAMTLAGVDARTAEPAGGRIVRDALGRPSGLFVDTAMSLVAARIPKPTRERLMHATRAAVAECNRWGITAVAEPGCDDDVLAAHVALIERGKYSIRNYAMLDDDAALLERHFARGPLDAAYDARLWTRAVKMYADGALGSRGAALLEPYADDPANRGLVVTPPEHLAAVTQRALRSGFQPCIHAIGDRANRFALDIFEAALADCGRDVRPRIEHAQVVSPPDIPRFAALGVIASMQTAHALSDMRWAGERLGNDRLAGAYAWRALLDAGATIANGTDAPVEAVSSARSFYAAVAGPVPAMTRREALAAMTIDAACANCQEKQIGSISLGKYGDFVMMDRDWMTTDAEGILETKILATFSSGREVYRAG